MGKRRDVLTESAPERIWLQVDTDGDENDRSNPIRPESWDCLTWHHEPIGGQEVVYVRADLADAQLQSEKARADAADSRLAALEAGMRGLLERLRKDADECVEAALEASEKGMVITATANDATANHAREIADELSALLNRPADGGE